MFRGINKVSLDGKSRMALPARSRELMLASGTGQLILTIDLREKCLMLYPLPEWEKVQTTLTGLANVRSDIRLVQRLLIGHATDGDLDSQGRVLIPKALREYALLKKRLVLLGQGNKIEIWDEAQWQERLEGWLDSDVIQSLDEIDELSGFSV
jgi:MraZ protein